MCDYSLENYASRPAAVGEKLVTHRFPSGSQGFTDGSHSEKGPVAVCMLPGAIVAFKEPVKKADGTRLAPDQLIARFTQLESRAYAYKDALEFDNGETLTLQQLASGQEATVETVPVASEPEAVKEGGELAQV